MICESGRRGVLLEDSKYTQKVKVGWVTGNARVLPYVAAEKCICEGMCFQRAGGYQFAWPRVRGSAGRFTYAVVTCAVRQPPWRFGKHQGGGFSCGMINKSRVSP